MNKHSLPNCVFCNEFEISLPKFSCLQRINICCLIVCSASNLGFAGELDLSAANL